MFNPPSIQKRSITRGGGQKGEDADFGGPGEGPLTPLVPGERIYVCRSPVSFKEPVANKHYQQPSVEEVLRQLKALGGGDWCIWELLFRKESLINKIGKEVRCQVLPYRVPELGLLSLSFLIAFISSMLYWLKLDQNNIAVITVLDDCDSHQCLLYGLVLCLRSGQAEAESSITDLHLALTSSLLRSSTLPQVRSPLATSRTQGMESFMAEPSSLLPSSRRQLEHLSSLLMTKERDIPVYRIKCVMIENFVGPAASVVVEVYHVNNTPLENGQLALADLLKRRKDHRFGRNVDNMTTPRAGDEWEQIWWRHLRTYHKRHKRLFRARDASGQTSNSTLHGAYDAFCTRRAAGRYKPLLSTAGELLQNSSSGEHHNSFRSDQSISLLPTGNSTAAETLSARDTVQGACCQWNFANLDLAVSGDAVVLVRQVCPIAEAPLRRWANGDVSFITPSKASEGSLSNDSHDVYSLVAIHVMHTAFLPNECYELGAKDFNYYSPGARENQPPINLLGVVNPSFKLHLIVEDAGRPATMRGSENLTTATPGAVGGMSCDVEDTDFMSPIDIPSPSYSSHGGTSIPPLNLDFTQAALSARKSLGKSLKDNKFFKLSGDRSARKSCGDRSGLVDLEEWLLDCRWRERHRRLTIDLGGDLSEFISRHCVVPDAAVEDWTESTGCTRQEMILCLKCCDNTFASAAMAERLFGHDSSFMETRSRERRSGRSLKTLINRITFNVYPFKQHATSGTNPASSATARAKTHKRTGSLDEADVIRCGEQKSNQCQSPPARMPSRRADILTEGPADSVLPAPKLTRVSSLPKDVDTKVAAPETETRTVETLGTPYAPPPARKVVARHDASTEASSDGQRTAEASGPAEETLGSAKASPTAPLATEPSSAVTKPALPNALLAAISSNAGAKKKPDPQAGATQTRPRLAPDLKGALLSRASAPNLTKELLVESGDAPKATAADELPSAGSRKTVGTIPAAGGGGLANLFAKRAAVESKAAGAPAEPARKAPLGRRLFWKPLETANLDDTVFGELSDSVLFAVDRENLSKVFSKEAKKSAAKRHSQTVASLASPEDDEGKKQVTVIDDRRAQNIGIVVLRLSHTPQELADQLMAMEFPSELAADLLEKLETIFFTEDEEQLLERHLKSGTEEELREVPERRLLPLRSRMVPRGKARTRILGADLNWSIWVTEMQESLDTIRKASAEMRSCACFRAMLSAVLRWGNFVNYGSNELHIKAITLSSLLKLTEFKTTIDAKVTSLHYIVATLLTSAEHIDEALALAHMTSEMRSVRGAAKITSEVLEGDWKQLVGARNFVLTELTSHRHLYEDQILSDGSHRVCGLGKLQAICERMQADIARLEKAVIETMTLVQSTARFFGDEEAAAGGAASNTRQFFVGNVFLTLDEFLRKFDDCIKDIVRRTAVYASILSEDQTPQLVKFVTSYTGKPLSKSAMMAIEANRDFTKLERTKAG